MMYSRLIDDYCSSSVGIGAVRLVEVAAAQWGGQYYLSGKESRGGGIHRAGAPMFMMPSTSDDATMVAERAIHEYTHVVQKASGGPMAGLAHGGRAVFNECWLGPS